MRCHRCKASPPLSMGVPHVRKLILFQALTRSWHVLLSSYRTGPVPTPANVYIFSFRRVLLVSLSPSPSCVRLHLFCLVLVLFAQRLRGWTRTASPWCSTTNGWGPPLPTTTSTPSPRAAGRFYRLNRFGGFPRMGKGSVWGCLLVDITWTS